MVVRSDAQPSTQRVPPSVPVGRAIPSAETQLWDAVGTVDVAASAELFRRHGDVAYAVARTITQDPDRAESAVVAAFVHVRDEATTRGPSRPLRLEVLDASRRCASRLVADAAPSGRRPPTDVFRSMPPAAREMLALAVDGRCGCLEIASIMDVHVGAVRRGLRGALDHAGALLDLRRPGTVDG